jgi:prephenate dehydrogenase
VRIAVVGLGLIGGSLALAAHERLDATVSGFDAEPAALEQAVARGAVQHRCASPAEAAAGAEAAFVAVPVGALPAVLAEVLAAAPGDCVVSDVGSVKRAVVAAVDDQRFVGGHPLAGAETAGIEHARADLFEGATWYLTPTGRTSGILYERLHRMLSALGARPAAIEAEMHDRLLALVSHLPHVLANALVAQAMGTLAGERLPAVGPSFRDGTRVAGAPSAIWTDIYLANRDALDAQLRELIARLEQARELLGSGDAKAIADWNDAAAADRRALQEAQLAGGELHELRASVPNRPGVIAQLALELGRAGVNIADLALYPAPDLSEGVAALWIAGGEAAERAVEVLRGLGFPVARA